LTNPFRNIAKLLSIVNKFCLFTEIVDNFVDKVLRRTSMLEEH